MKIRSLKKSKIGQTRICKWFRHTCRSNKPNHLRSTFWSDLFII